MKRSKTGIPAFVDLAQAGIDRTIAKGSFEDTRRNRVQRRYSTREVSELLGFHRSVLNTWLDHPDAPKGVEQGRENTYSLSDVLKIRALSAMRRKGSRPALFWRTPEDPLPVVTFSSQKGGTAKSLTAAHFAQYISLYYGLRVGIVDCDPQATLSLYFADEKTKVADVDTPTFTDFMGVPPTGQKRLHHDTDALNEFWTETPWPGIRLMPGGASIQEADISMFYLAQNGDDEERHVYRYLRDTINRWSEAHPPRTNPEDLFDDEGRLIQERFDAALTETLDIIVIDCAPALTLSQLNAVVAASTLIVPNTLRGFDLATLRVYLASLEEYLSYVRTLDETFEFPDLPSYILPTNVSSTGLTDTEQVGLLYSRAKQVTCPVYYGHSAAVANAALKYQSIYEFEAPRNRRQSAEKFTINANAVGDAILSKAVERLPSRGFANAFLVEKFEGAVEPWTVDAEGASANTSGAGRGDSAGNDNPTEEEVA